MTGRRLRWLGVAWLVIFVALVALLTAAAWPALGPFALVLVAAACLLTWRFALFTVETVFMLSVLKNPRGVRMANMILATAHARAELYAARRELARLDAAAAARRKSQS